MSVRYLNHAWTQIEARGIGGLGTVTKLVYIALADRADDDGRCWPSRRTIAAKCGVSEAAVKRALKNLETAGLLSRTRRRRPNGTLGTWLFTLAFDQGTNLTRGVGDQGTPATRRPRVASDPTETTTTETDKGRHVVRGGAAEGGA